MLRWYELPVISCGELAYREHQRSHTWWWSRNHPFSPSSCDKFSRSLLLREGSAFRFYWATIGSTIESAAMPLTRCSLDPSFMRVWGQESLLSDWFCSVHVLNSGRNPCWLGAWTANKTSIWMSRHLVSNNGKWHGMPNDSSPHLLFPAYQNGTLRVILGTESQVVSKSVEKVVVKAWITTTGTNQREPQVRTWYGEQPKIHSLLKDGREAFCALAHHQRAGHCYSKITSVHFMPSLRAMAQTKTGQRQVLRGVFSYRPI